jgi:hypothetical protein
MHVCICSTKKFTEITHSFFLQDWLDLIISPFYCFVISNGVIGASLIFIQKLVLRIIYGMVQGILNFLENIYNVKKWFAPMKTKTMIGLQR